MRKLPELLASSEGRAFLESRGVFTTENAFLDMVRRPVRSALGELIPLQEGQAPVYSGNQVKADYPPSVVSKIHATRDVGTGSPDVAPVLIWLDMDRAGADRLTTGFQIRGRGGTVHVRLAPRRHDVKEVRFVPVDRADLQESARRLGAWARQHGDDVAERETRLAEALLAASPRTLAEANLATTSFLLREHLRFDPPAVLVSDLATRGLLTQSIEETIDRIDDVISVFNGAVDALTTADIDPQVQRLGPDYLPLHYSCDRDDRRCKLKHELRGADHFAVTACSCGERYEFPLGTTSLSIAELAATGRWSVDVTLPLYLNDLAGGVVTGQSSALYGLVLNEVLEKVLGRTPIPMLVPEDLTAILEADQAASLLAEYLAAR